MENAKVMIVEDNAMVAEDCRACLESLGYSVVCTVASGEESIRRAEADRPDVVLMDIRLGDRMDGIDAAGAIHDRFDIPVLFLTAYSDPDLLQRAKMVGSFGYLIKPFEERELMAMLEVTLYKARMERERRELEARLEAARKQEALGRIIGGVCHLFNNMLAAVIGNLELEQDELAREGRDPENLMEAKKAAQRAVEVNRRMMDYLGCPRLEQIPLDLSRIIRYGLEKIRKDLPKGVSVEANLPDPGPKVDADWNRAGEMFRAMATNAVEAIGKESTGRITVSVETADVADIPRENRFPPGWKEAAPSYARLSVADTGVGIPPENLELIFDPFFTDKFLGRGLGLAVALGAAQNHGGCITVETAPGRGSLFQVFFPLSPESPGEAVCGEAQKARGAFAPKDAFGIDHRFGHCIACAP
jgi:signal transduction histidine kinase